MLSGKEKTPRVRSQKACRRKAGERSFFFVPVLKAKAFRQQTKGPFAEL